MGDEQIITTLKFLATGLVRWHKQITEANLTYPYPVELQIGLDKLAGQSLILALDYPKDIPDLVNWFNQPLTDWPQLRDTKLFSDDESLLIGNQPSETCYELAVDGDVEQELTEQLMLRALNSCRERGSNEDYVRFRRFIIEHPALEMSTVINWTSNRCNGVAASLLKDAYETLPPSTFGTDASHHVCSYCGWVLDWQQDQARCIHPYCATKTNHFRKRKDYDGVNGVRLKRGLMRFVAWPGRWELKLEAQLNKLNAGLKVEMWPCFDTYDLRITFPNGEVWAVDVKDWRNPYLLAKNVKPFPQSPEWHRAFWVVPNHYWREWQGYGEEFKRFYTLAPNEAICSMSELLRRVQSRLEREV